MTADQPMPLDPHMVEGAQQIHALFVALQLAGFTEDQALRLTSDMISARFGGQP